MEDSSEDLVQENDLDSNRLSGWLTALANFGVLLGLAVLIFEIRQNNELTMAQIEQSRSEAFLNWRQEEVLNDHLAPLIARFDQLALETYGHSLYYTLGQMDPAERQEETASILDKLEPVDRVRFENYLQRSYWDYENVYFQYKRGLVSEAYWTERIVPAIIANAPDWKASNGGVLNTGRIEFNLEVERLLSAE
jgi:hypothetical protein